MQIRHRIAEGLFPSKNKIIATIGPAFNIFFNISRVLNIDEYPDALSLNYISNLLIREGITCPASTYYIFFK